MSTILCLSDIDWGFLRYRKQHLMTHLSERHQIVYVNPPRAIKSRTPWRWNRIESIHSNLTVYDPPVLPFGLLEPAGTDWIVNKVRRLLERKPHAPLVLWCYSPHALRFVGRFDEQLVVYDMADDDTSPSDLLARNRREGLESAARARLERVMLERADIVLSASRALAEKKADLRRGIRVVPNGCDYTRFAAAPVGEPKDLGALPHPRLLFAGAIWPRVDLDLLGRIADGFTHGSVVLLGPVLSGLDVSRLLGRPNVHWLGPKPHDELPRYFAYSDVGLLPFKPTEPTRCSSPLKLWEYLAAGRPVVSVPIPQVEELAGDVTRIATSDQFVEAIRESLELDSALNQAARRRLAQRHSWSLRAMEVEDLLSSTLVERNPNGLDPQLERLSA